MTLSNTTTRRTTARRLPRGYAALDAFLGTKLQRTLCNNTIAERGDLNTWGTPGIRSRIDVRLHATVIATFWSDGRVRLNSGGWRTVTTKARINALLPDGMPRLFQEKREWYFEADFGTGVAIVEFEDGMVLESQNAPGARWAIVRPSNEKGGTN